MISRLAKSASTPFHEFARLPAEIQLIIWEFAAVVNEYIIQISRPPRNMFGIRRAPGTPAALYVCHDSRAKALQVYRSYFSAIDGHGAYFNPDRDILDLSIISSSTWLLLQYPNLRPDLRMVQSAIMHPEYMNAYRLPHLNSWVSTIGVPPRPVFEVDPSWMQGNLCVIYGVRGVTVERKDFEDHDSFARDRLMISWDHLTAKDDRMLRQPLQLTFLSPEDSQAIEHHLRS